MLGSRIKEAADRIGGLNALVPHLGGDISRRTLTDYVAGKSEPKASTLIAISNACGVRLLWLMTADGPQVGAEHETGLNANHLGAALSIVEEWLDENDRLMQPAKKADVVAQIYQFIVEDIEEGRSPMDKKRAQQILRLVA